MRTTLVTIVNNRGRQISRINKHKKSRKKGLTLPPDSDRIAKLSQRDGAEKAQKAARKREKSWRGKAAGAKRERKNLEKRWKKFLTKRTRCDTIIWLSQTRSGQKRKRFWKNLKKCLTKRNGCDTIKRLARKRAEHSEPWKLNNESTKKPVIPWENCLTAKYSNKNEQHGYFKKKKPV